MEAMTSIAFGLPLMLKRLKTINGSPEAMLVLGSIAFSDWAEKKKK